MLRLRATGHDGVMSNDKQRPIPERPDADAMNVEIGMAARRGRDAFDDARGESLLGTTYGGDIAETREPAGFNTGKGLDEAVSVTESVAQVETAIPALHDPVDDELFSTHGAGTELYSTHGMGTEIVDELMTDASTMEFDDEV